MTADRHPKWSGDSENASSMAEQSRGLQDDVRLESPKQRLHILRFIDEIKEVSAPYNQLSLALRDKHDITICTLFKPEIILPEEIALIEGDGSLRRWLGNLRIALRRDQFEIIHAHNPYTAMLLPIASVVFGKFRIPRIYTVHNSYQNHKLRNRLMLIPVFAFFDRVVFCGYAASKSFPLPLRVLGGKRLCIVQNGVDIERISSVLEKKVALNLTYSDTCNFTVITIGRLTLIKNHSTTLEAFKECHDNKSTLVVIGEGALKNHLEHEIQELDLGQRVELTGVLPRDEVFVRLAVADLFVSASNGEGLPVSVLEAMACQCPVVLSDIPPHREITDGVDFIPLVHPDDVLGFAREIRKYRLMAPSERRAIGEKCRELVKSRFSLSRMHDGYDRVYMETLAQRFSG